MKNNAQQLADMIRDRLAATAAGATLPPPTLGRLAQDIAEGLLPIFGSCPQCGAEIGPRVKPTVMGTIVDFGNGQRYVTEQRLAQILAILVNRFGYLVAYETIATTINEAEDAVVDPMSDATMKVHINRLRIILADTPFEILTHWGQGYSLHSRSYVEGLHDLRSNTHGTIRTKEKLDIRPRAERRKPRRRAVPE